MRDPYFTITTYVTSLGSAFAGMPTAGLTLQAVIELAKKIELRLIRQGVMPDFYKTGGTRVEGYQSSQHTKFQIGSSSQPKGSFQQGQRPQERVHKSGRHGHNGARRPIIFGLSATSSSS